MTSTLLTLLVLFLAVAAAPILNSLLGRVVGIPLVVVEIVLGLLIGPALLGWVEPDTTTQLLSRLGVGMLLFLAGYEIDYSRIVGRPLVRASVGWVVSLVLGVIVGLVVASIIDVGEDSILAGGLFIGICLTSTALGTIMPALRDAGETTTPFGQAIIASGTLGQFGPLLAVAILLGGRHPLISLLALVVFAIVAFFGVRLAVKGPTGYLSRLIANTLHTSGQFAVRLVLAVLVVLAILSVALGLDLLMGAFVAGGLGRVLLAHSPVEERLTIEHKLQSIGYGFLVPIFFVMTGVTFDLAGLIEQPLSLALIPVFLVLFLLVRGIPGSATVAAGSSLSDRAAAMLLSATGLAIIVAVAAAGVEAGALDSVTAAALVGAGMCSVLLFPALALTLRRRGHPEAGHDPKMSKPAPSTTDA